MPVIRAQVELPADTNLPRDIIVNTLHFNVDTATPLDDINYESLADDLLTLWQARVGSTREVRVKFYDLSEPEPRFPKKVKTRNSGTVPVSGGPRELALCLSFRGDQNVPRKRGRIFFPAFPITGSFGVRPSASNQQALLTLAQGLADLGGANVDWVVYSPTTGDDWPVKQAWVDDEWDVVRSRGLRATGRQTLSLDEQLEEQLAQVLAALVPVLVLIRLELEVRERRRRAERLDRQLRITRRTARQEGRRSYDVQGDQAGGEQVPRPVTLDGVPVAPWIAPRLRWARREGWQGRVVSGVRSNAEQRRLYDEFRAGKRAGPVAKPGTSNHERVKYPGGAVDVTHPEQLAALMKRWPGRGAPLRWFGPGDAPHFSHSGR